MKKIIMICLAIAMVASMGISVFATTGGFVSSPSGKPAPELVDGKNESEECVAKIVITAYSDRDKLSEDARKKIEEAYSDIIGTQDLSSLNGAIDDIAKKLGLNSSDLAVSDLFDISATNCDGHGDHGHFDITLKSDTLKNFICLLHYYDGEWHIVENAEVTHNGEHLEFDEDQLSPFAIVVSTGKAPVEPADTENSPMVVAIIAAAVAVIVFVILLAFKRKKKEA